VQLAEQVTMLSQLSGGRLHLGIGRGGPWRDLEVFGTGLQRWESGFPSSLALLMECLGSAVVGSAGQFDFRPVPMVPAPLAVPPVTVACTSLDTVSLAAAHGLPMLLGMDLSAARKAAMISHYVDSGGGPAPHIGAALAHVGPVSELRSAMPGWLGPGLAGYVTVDGRPRRPVDPVEYMDKLIGMHPVGSPDECVVRLRATARESGIDHFILMVDGCGTPAVTRRTIQRLGEEVLPRLRG
jgi:alkanesulfonate monooxygenase SsuD/methylene tetrahydromethanopterin reductase-like flavin-dependent oxidoreductase (luciferase family)